MFPHQDSGDDNLYGQHLLSSSVLQRTATVNLLEINRNALASTIGWVFIRLKFGISDSAHPALLYVVAAGSVAPPVVSGILTFALALYSVAMCLWERLLHQLWLAGYW